MDKLAIEPEAVDDDFNEDEALEQAEAEPVTKLRRCVATGQTQAHVRRQYIIEDDMAVLMNGEMLQTLSSLIRHVQCQLRRQGRDAR